MTMKIGVMGGSFDPPHIGHKAIARSFVESSCIDRLWVLPTPAPPHKTDVVMADFEHRLQMARRCFESEAGVEVDELENKLPPPHYTVKTLQSLSEKWPDYRFIYCLGQDLLESIESWYKWEELLGRYEILVASRPGAQRKNGWEKYHIHWVDHTPHDISSTQIRELLKQGELPREMLCGNVADYIAEHHLYSY